MFLCRDQAEVLLQIVRRVHTTLSMSQFLKVAAGFSSTPTKAHVVVGVRSLPESRADPAKLGLYIYHCPHTALNQLWPRLTATFKVPSTFLTEDGPFLWHTLIQLGLNPMWCRVRLEDWSMSRVYAITTPEVWTYPSAFSLEPEEKKTLEKKQKKVMAVHSDKPQLAMKVVLDGDDFKNELSALSQTSEVWSSVSGAQFFALAAYSAGKTNGLCRVFIFATLLVNRCYFVLVRSYVVVESQRQGHSQTAQQAKSGSGASGNQRLVDERARGTEDRWGDCHALRQAAGGTDQ
jgi:hypothetical protein